MPFMLVALFVFALLVTFAGFFLSFKSQVRDQKVIFTHPRAGRRAIDDMPADVPRYGRNVRIIAYRDSRSISIPSLGGRLRGRRKEEPVPWVVVVAGLASIFVVGLFAFNLLVAHNAVFSPIWFSNSAQAQAQSTPQTNAPVLYGVSQHVVRISQLDPGQYSSVQDYTLWAYSACSAAAMTEVINAYGHHYRIADILKVEASLNEITPALGLVEDIGVARTVAKFGFKANWGYSLSYDQVIATANQGEPVIVGFPPARYPGGHLVVVVGGNSQTVFIADSSLYNRHSLSRSQFMKWWAGYSAVVTPA